MGKEIWKNVRGYRGKYQVSNKGRVKSLYGGNERILKAGANDNGRLYVILSKNSEGKVFYIHRLVAMAFLGKVNMEGSQVCHNDSNHLNNRLDNLRLDSQSENRIDEYRTGNGKLNGLTAKDVFQIRQLYKHKIYKQSELAKIYNSHQPNINRIINKNIFAFINDDGTIDDSTTGFDMHDRVKQLTYSSGEIDSGKLHGNNKVLQRFNNKVIDVA